MVKKISDTPLAEVARPTSFDHLLGQDHIWGQGAPLRLLVERDAFNSLILWGPSGSGKTTLALLVGAYSGREMVMLSAVDTGVKEIRSHLNRSQLLKDSGEKSLLLFMDEIHRLNKAQQDVLLPALEKGVVKFIGATTENPSFEVNHAVLSRSLVFKFEKIASPSMVNILTNALNTIKTTKDETIQVEKEVLDAVALSCDGDARKGITILDAIIESAPQKSHISKDGVSPLILQIAQNYDKGGDMHYDTISAFIKSIRASHPDAAIYYLARMIEAGEDPMFIARRLVVSASEDIGNANPTALLVATSGMQAVHMTGYPEARIILSQVTTYLSSSPKSNRSYLAIDKAINDVKQTGSLPIPLHLRNAPTRLMKEFGYGENYIYPHDHPDEYRKQSYLPREIGGIQYYAPSDIGVEKQFKENLKRIRPLKD